MNVELTAINAATTQIKILVPAEESGAQWNKYLQKFSKKADVPGFRKGKAPLQMVERMYSAQVMEGFYRHMIDEYFEAAVNQEKLSYLLFPDVKDITWEKGSDMAITIEIEHEPNLELKQLDNLRVPFNFISLGNEVDNYLEKLQEQNKRYVDVDVASPGDTVEVEYSLTVKGQELTLNAKVYADDSIEHRSIPELVGKKTGDVIQKELSGMMIKLSSRDSTLDLENDTLYPVNIMVNSSVHTQTPELNDDFAKDLEFDSLDAMKAKLADELRAGNDARELERKISTITGKLFVDNNFALPLKTIEYLAEREAEKEPNEVYHKYLEYQYKMQLSRDFIRLYINKALRLQLGIVATPELTEEYIRHLAILEDISPEAYKEANKESIANEDFAEEVANFGAYLKLMETAEFYEPEPDSGEEVQEAELVEPEISEEPAPLQEEA